jgi:hypothetical protein
MLLCMSIVDHSRRAFQQDDIISHHVPVGLVCQVWPSRAQRSSCPLDLEQYTYMKTGSQQAFTGGLEALSINPYALLPHKTTAGSFFTMYTLLPRFLHTGES